MRLFSMKTLLWSATRSIATSGTGASEPCDTVRVFPTILSWLKLTMRTYEMPTAALALGDEIVSTTNGWTLVVTIVL